MSILVINAGSTSLKFGLFDDDAQNLLASGGVSWADGKRGGATLAYRARDAEEVKSAVDVRNHHDAAHSALQILGSQANIRAVGHRVVHGGTEFRESVLIDENVIGTIARLAELAPLHNPPALEAIKAIEAALPGVPEAAVFDTAFFAALPPRAYVYPLPYEWHQKWGIRRFGFHGISHAYCTQRAADLLGRPPAELRLVTCHLGGGCSATAVHRGVPVSTTMGFTPIEGLMMTTRPGSVDPGVLLHLLRRQGLTVDELDEALHHRSGLLGVAGVSATLSQVEKAAQQGNERAQLAYQMFVDRIRSTIGALTVTLGGIDALVFTAKIGEIFPSLRAAVCENLECLGLRLDQDRNAACQPDADIATADSVGRILVIETREDLMIARETARLLTA